jgi:hypothetical protein
MTTQPQIRLERNTTPPAKDAGNVGHPELHPVHDACEYFREYARQRPDVVAIWCLGIGFVLGWKLKPW